MWDSFCGFVYITVHENLALHIPDLTRYLRLNQIYCHCNLKGKFSTSAWDATQK